MITTQCQCRLWWVAILVIFASVAVAGELKTESFDRDPGWEGKGNRVFPKEYPTITQNFGYGSTNHAGKSTGEMGGLVTRASEPAFYAANIGKRTLDEKLSASGSFTITKATSGGGLFFGFFRAEQPGGGGRPTGSLGLNIDTEHSGARLAVRLITEKNQSCGTFITPFIPGKFRPTPIRGDGTRYRFTLDYDPAAAGGNGRYTFTFHGDQHKPGELITPDMPATHREEARTHFPDTTTFSVDLPAGYKQQGTTFDHFGAMNMMKAGGQVTIFFDDLTYAGQSQDFSSDPNWDGSGNRTSYQAKDVGGAHDFGFSEKTSHAGGKPGEVGGVLWRSGDFGYYADRIGPLGLEGKLEARGKVQLVSGGPDSDMYFGWFSSATSQETPAENKDFIGVHVGGPTRVGHYFSPRMATAKGTLRKAESAPVLTPGKIFDWSLVYDPAGARGNGELRVTLGKESVTLALKPGQKVERASLDRFGLFTSTIGGQMVKVYFDELIYTAAPSK